MTDDTIVAVFDTQAHASAAVRDLENAGVPASAITQHAKGGMTTTAAPVREEGFWQSLFGGAPDYQHDTTVYDRSLEAGSTVVTVRAGGHYLENVMDILERHSPIDIDERAASYGVGSAGTIHTAGDKTIPLAEEQLTVGKRAVNRGTTRIRRYVIETPVEEQVSLRDETVSVERRPVSDGGPVTGADFTEKVVEMTETAEEAVVSKTARVKEEVLIRKDATERTETIHDTVRREDVEVTKDAGIERRAGTPAASTTAPYPKV
jgi:uncharacterized protein (TIGR02271 family)